MRSFLLKTPTLSMAAPTFLGQARSDLLAHDAGEPGPITVGADHDLQRAVAMHAAKIEVALGRHVGDVGRDVALLAQRPDARRGGRVVDRGQHHVCAVQVARLEGSVHVLHLALRHAVRYFAVQTRAWTHDGHFGVGVEDVQDSACGDLGEFFSGDGMVFVIEDVYLASPND